MSCSASPRNRDLISVCSASAVRFIGTQRPSIAIENDVSTSSATQAWVRASVSWTSTSSMLDLRTGRVARAAYDAVEHGARDVPRLGVAELPVAGGAGQLARRARAAQLALALTARHLLGDVAQQRLAELAHRLGGQPQVAVGAALEGAAVAERLLELLEGARVDRGLVAELAGELVEVEVVHPGAAVGLAELLGQVVEVGDVLEDAGAVAEAEPLLAVHPLRAAPVLAGPQGLEVGVEPGQ